MKAARALDSKPKTAVGARRDTTKRRRWQLAVRRYRDAQNAKARVNRERRAPAQADA